MIKDREILTYEQETGEFLPYRQQQKVEWICKVIRDLTNDPDEIEVTAMHVLIIVTAACSLLLIGGWLN